MPRARPLMLKTPLQQASVNSEVHPHNRRAYLKLLAPWKQPFKVSTEMSGMRQFSTPCTAASEAMSKPRVIAVNVQLVPCWLCKNNFICSNKCGGLDLKRKKANPLDRLHSACFCP